MGNTCAKRIQSLFLDKFRQKIFFTFFCQDYIKIEPSGQLMLLNGTHAIKFQGTLGAFKFKYLKLEMLALIQLNIDQNLLLYLNFTHNYIAGREQKHVNYDLAQRENTSTTFLPIIALIGLKITHKIDFDVLSSKMEKYLILSKSNLKFFIAKIIF